MTQPSRNALFGPAIDVMVTTQENIGPQLEPSIVAVYDENEIVIMLAPYLIEVSQVSGDLVEVGSALRKRGIIVLLVPIDQDRS